MSPADDAATPRPRSEGAGLTIRTVTLNSGHDMPLIGLGTWPLQGSACTQAVLSAFEVGYRLIDTAAHYGNEAAVGSAISASALPREDMFVTSKLQGRFQGREFTRTGVEQSLQRLGVDYLDLFLIHWPMPNLGRYLDTYAELVKISQEGLIRSAGVSNFKAPQLDAIVDATGVLPAVNQLQVSPSHSRTDLVSVVQASGSVVQAWSPLERNSGILENSVIAESAERHEVTPAQVVLRWLIQRGVAPVPQSSNPSRQRSNADVFGFSLMSEEVAAIAGLDHGMPVEQDSDTYEEF